MNFLLVHWMFIPNMQFFLFLSLIPLFISHTHVISISCHLAWLPLNSNNKSYSFYVPNCLHWWCRYQKDGSKVSQEVMWSFHCADWLECSSYIKGSLAPYYHFLVRQKEDKIQSSKIVVRDFHLYSWFYILLCSKDYLC